MRRWLLLLLALVWNGCAHYQSRPLSPEQSAAQLAARRLDDPRLKIFLEQNLGRAFGVWPKTNWTLPELTLVAFYFHPSLEVARAQWLLASAGLKTAGARPNPSVSLTPGYDAQIPGNYSPWLVPLTFDVPVETAGKRGKRLAEAEKVSESARWNFAVAAWQIRSGVRNGLVELKSAGRRVALLQTEFSAQQEIVQRLQQRLDAGAIARPELTTAQIALGKMQLELGDAKAGAADARSHFAEALGLSEAALAGETFDAAFAASDLKALTAKAARGLALRARADILAALADYAAAEADLRLQIAKQYPDLHFGPGYAWNSGNAGDNQWSLGVTLELPILDQNQGAIAEAEARRKLAAAKFNELQAQISGQIDRAVAGLRVAREQLQIGKSLVAAELKQEQSAAAQLKIGAAEPLDLLAAKLEAANTSLLQLDNEIKLQAAVGALEDALQSPADSAAALIEKIFPMNSNANASPP